MAGNAVKLAAAALRHQQQRTVLDDRDQNLGRLADMIVTDLFSLGFDLHALSSAVTQADEGTPMASTVDTIDQAIQQIRLAVFAPR